MRGVLAGALALITLHTVVTYKGATGRIGGAFAGIAGLVDRFLDPGLPAIGEPASTPATGPGGSGVGAQAARLYPPPVFTPG